jgi:hypothetical protein
MRPLVQKIKIDVLDMALTEILVNLPLYIYEATCPKE